jgi:hypothetical protein
LANTKDRYLGMARIRRQNPGSFVPSGQQHTIFISYKEAEQ